MGRTLSIFTFTFGTKRNIADELEKKRKKVFLQ